MPAAGFDGMPRIYVCRVVVLRHQPVRCLFFLRLRLHLAVGNANGLVDVTSENDIWIGFSTVQDMP